MTAAILWPHTLSMMCFLSSSEWLSFIGTASIVIHDVDGQDVKLGQEIPHGIWWTEELEMDKLGKAAYDMIHGTCALSLGGGFSGDAESGLRNMTVHRRLCHTVGQRARGDEALGPQSCVTDAEREVVIFRRVVCSRTWHFGDGSCTKYTPKNQHVFNDLVSTFKGNRLSKHHQKKGLRLNLWKYWVSDKFLVRVKCFLVRYTNAKRKRSSIRILNKKHCMI